MSRRSCLSTSCHRGVWFALNRWRGAVGGRVDECNGGEKRCAALHPCAHCDITTQQQFKLRAWASTSGEAGVQSKDPGFCCGSSVLQRSALLHPSGPQLPPILEFSYSPYRFPDSSPPEEPFCFALLQSHQFRSS